MAIPPGLPDGSIDMKYMKVNVHTYFRRGLFNIKLLQDCFFFFPRLEIRLTSTFHSLRGNAGDLSTLLLFPRKSSTKKEKIR